MPARFSAGMTRRICDPAYLRLTRIGEWRTRAFPTGDPAESQFDYKL